TPPVTERSRSNSPRTTYAGQYGYATQAIKNQSGLLYLLLCWCRFYAIWGNSAVMLLPNAKLAEKYTN
ncbi:hypothetical protein VB671_24070, partial [Nodularia spumigena UHCC 0040]|nr:hypothetical protein [Nodularia spumigena UHCC 0040]